MCVTGLICRFTEKKRKSLEKVTKFYFTTLVDTMEKGFVCDPDYPPTLRLLFKLHFSTNFLKTIFLTAGWRLLRKKSSLPNGFPRDNPSDRDSNSEGSDSARTQIEFPTWNSHESTQRFLDTAEDKRYYRIWIDPSEKAATSRTKADRYETVYPSENPPPLPPRCYHPKHRPLERTKAVEHGSSSPPKVSRQYKPFYPCEAPVVPPRPLKKFVNPEDAFNFEIVDIDEQSELKCGLRNGKHSYKGDFNDAAPLATPESDSADFAHKSHEGFKINHSSQNCDIRATVAHSNLAKQNERTDSSIESRLKPSKDACNETSVTCRLLNVPEVPNSASPISPDSGVALSEGGGRDCSGSSTGNESEIESARSRQNRKCDPGSVRGHKLLSRQISHPPDNCSSSFLRGGNDRLGNQNANELQCPPTPTHHARRFRNGERDSPLPASSRQVSSTRSPMSRRKREDLNSMAASDSSNSDSDVPSQTLRQRMVRLPSISENTQIQKVEVLPDGDGLPPGEFAVRF